MVAKLKNRLKNDRKAIQSSSDSEDENAYELDVRKNSEVKKLLGHSRFNSMLNHNTQAYKSTWGCGLLCPCVVETSGDTEGLFGSV